jgi:Fe-S cluster assembly iron-binding protein IscA
MLALTPSAIEVVNTITAASGLPESAGLRIAPATESSQAESLELELVPTPGESDQVMADQTGARVFLAEGAAAYLADKVLDGQLDDQGRARFALGNQVDGSNGTPPA